jgi:hypothetical protein
MKRIVAILVVFLLAISFVFASDSLKSLVDTVLKVDGELTRSLSQYDATMKKAQTRMEDELAAEIAAIDSRPFTDKELDKNGNPTKKALEAREKERAEATKRLEKNLSDAIDTIQAKYGPDISAAYDVLCTSVDSINSTEFILSTTDGSLEVVFDPYVEAEHGWNLSAYPVGFENAIVHGAFLDFNVISSKSYKKFKAEALQEAVLGFDQQLKDLGPLSTYSVSATVTAFFDKDLGVLSFVVEKLEFNDSSRKKGRSELLFPDNSEEVFYSTYVPFDMNNYTFALTKAQLRELKRETAAKNTNKVVSKVGKFVNSIELYALANGRLGIGLIPEAERTTSSPAGFMFSGGADVFLRVGRVMLGVNPYIGMVMEEKVMDLSYTLAFDLYGNDDPDADLGCIIVRYGTSGGGRYEIAFREFTPKDPGKVIDLASGFEAGLVFYPEFNYIPGIYLSFAIGGGLGFPH